MSSDDASATDTQAHPETAFAFDVPTLSDGRRLWQLAADSQTLDLNTRYSYVLWCRDFAATSMAARDSQGLAGFIIGYRRPEANDTLFVWQVAVAAHQRRQGLARQMLDHLAARLAPHGVRYVEATVTPDNMPSARLFASFAAANDAKLTRDELFSEEVLGGGHEAEILYRIGPLSPFD